MPKHSVISISSAVKLLIICTVVFLGAGCKGARDTNAVKNKSGFKPSSQGAPYELVIVADHPQWNGAVGDSLRNIFNRQVPMINREERMFDVLRVLPDGFKKLVSRHPNVMIINVGEKYEQATMNVLYDVYAQPQIVIVANAPDNASMAKMIGGNSAGILAVLEGAVRDRDLYLAKTQGPKTIKNKILDKFGFEMDLTPGYTVRNEGDDFLWLSFEMPMSSQGVIIYTYPYRGVNDFTAEALIASRNKFVANIPGPSAGSYMITNDEIFELGYKKINGRVWSELHGFWDVAGDFMGGPFVNFSTLDAPHQRVIAIDFYVYSPNPKLSQRSYKRQLEHFIYSVVIPEN